MPIYDLSPGFLSFNGGLEAFDKAVAARERNQLLQTLGQQLRAGDYDGAVVTAFKSGDVPTGLAIQKLKTQAQASAGLAAGIGGPPAPDGGEAQASAAPAQAASSSAGSASDSALSPYAKAISAIESGNSYAAEGPVTAGGDRAYGRYQVMGANIPSWTREALGQELTPQQFLASPQAQDKVFAQRFGQYLSQTGNPRDAASLWFTGRPLAQGAAMRDILGTSGQDYVDKFSSGLAGASGAGAPQAGLPPSSTPPNLTPQSLAQPGKAPPNAIPQSRIDAFQAANPSTVGDETLLPDGSFKMDADPQGLAWAARNAASYGLAADPDDPSRFVAAQPGAGAAPSGAAPSGSAPPQPAARQAALTAQLPAVAAQSATRIDALPQGNNAKLDYYLRMQALAAQTGNDGYAAIYKQKAELEKEALAPTGARRDYEYYFNQERGAGRTPLSFADYNDRANDPVSYTSLVDPAARAAAGISPDDNGIYQQDSHGRLFAVRAGARGGRQ